MAKKQKYYVVWEGHESGIYHSWSACQLQIKGYAGAKYKSFTSLQEAKAAFEGVYADHISRKVKPASRATLSKETRKEIIWESMAVDAACSGNPGKMEYRGVDTSSGDEFFRVGPFIYGTNNIGEFLALVHALALLKKSGKPDLPVYSDSKTAMSWVRNKKIRSNLKKLPQNKKIFELIDRALFWLQNNTYENPILKWKTEDWGEIPADFGRK